MQASFLLYALILTTATILNLCECHVPIPCRPCMNHLECDAVPRELCLWGEARDACGRRVCAKGPGEFCGGNFQRMGVCGEGMICTTSLMDNNVEKYRCHGCSTYEQIECYP